MVHNIKKLLFATACGALFALGLVISGMTQSAKVIGFLNLAGLWDAQRYGTWDPSLAFVMGGALCVTLVAFAITTRPGRTPWLAARFELPRRKDIDLRLLLGAALFGIGWGIAGYCPGPALASLLVNGADAVIFVACMAAGMWAAKRMG